MLNIWKNLDRQGDPPSSDIVHYRRLAQAYPRHVVLFQYGEFGTGYLAAADALLRHAGPHVVAHGQGWIAGAYVKYAHVRLDDGKAVAALVRAGQAVAIANSEEIRPSPGNEPPPLIIPLDDDYGEVAFETL